MLDISSDNETQITADGTANEICNGFFSWVYEEEIFSDYNAIWWSPDSTHFVYMRSNESAVPTFSFPIYGTPGAYPSQDYFKYPKSGYPNPSVTLAVVNTVSTQVEFLVLFVKS